MVPTLARAGEHGLAVKNAICFQSGDCDPVALTAQISDFLAIDEGNRPHMGEDRLLLDRGGISGEPSRAVGRKIALPLPARIGGLQLPVWRHELRSLSIRL